MVLGIGDTTTVTLVQGTEIKINNTAGDTTALGTIGEYFEGQIEYRSAVKVQTLATCVLLLAQMVLYWNAYSKAEAKRDAAIDKEISFISAVESYKLNGTLISLLRKRKVAYGLDVPDIDACANAVRYQDETFQDGTAVDNTAKHLARRASRGIPDGWGTHSGQLAAALAATNAGSFMAGNSRIRHEEFEDKKVGIVQASESGMKAIHRSSTIIGYYQQATAVYSGLADIYIQGFNSAGAGLGAALGQLTQSGAAKTSGNASSAVLPATGGNLEYNSTSDLGGDSGTMYS